MPGESDDLINALLRQYSAPQASAMEPNALSGEADGILQGYGHGYSDPRIGMDADDVPTQDVLALMGARQAAKDREPYEALTRLLTTAMVPMAAAHNASGNLPKAISRHVKMEQGFGNPLVTPAQPFLWPYLTAMTPSMARAMRGAELGPADVLPSFVGRTLDRVVPGELLAPHLNATAQILNHLNRTEPKTKTLY